MADQGVSNERKRELEQMDPFQEAMVKGLAYASAHKRQIGLVIGAIVAVVVIFSGIMYSFKQSEIKASQLVAKATAEYAKAADPKEGFQAVNDQFTAIFEDYANTSAGRMALVSYAKICFDAGEYDQAIVYYTRALSELGDETGMENFILSALGNLSQIKNEPEKAKSYYLRIENGSSDLLKDEARFALAILYEAENDLAASLKMYEKIIAENDGSIYKSIAQARVDGAR